MKVLTNKGNKEFAGIRKTSHNKYYELEFDCGTRIDCTVDHIFETLDGPISAKKLNKNHELIKIDGNTFLSRKKLIRRKFEAYDLLEVDDGSLYFTNNVLSHNCSFLGSSNTLISASKLQHLVFDEPVVEQKNLKVYEQPVPGNKYVATVDVAAGLSMDFSIINIIDVTEAPYKQVLVYKNNEIDPTSFSLVVDSIGKKYNYAHLIVESNNDGKIVCKELWDMEYENLISTKSEMGDNIIKSGRRSAPGIMMTKLTKKVGCSKLKDLIETEVLIIRDSDTISELGTFVLSKGSYEAEQGKHDDIVMCLVMFAWFSSTVYFDDVTGRNTSELIKSKRDDEDLHTLLGFISDGEDIFDNSSSGSYGFW